MHRMRKYVLPPIDLLLRRLRSDSRLLAIFKGSASGIAGKGLMMLVSAITLPLTVRYLGKLEYGIWVTISTSVVMLATLDLGIANTLTNFISQAYAEEDERLAQHYFATALWVTVGVSILLGAIGTLVLPRINWASLFRLADPAIADQARRSVFIAFAFFLISLPLDLAKKVLSGYQEVHLANYFAALTSVLTLIAIVAVVIVRGSLVELTAAYCAAVLAGGVLLNLWLFLRHRPGLLPSPRAVRGSVTRDLFGEGVMFFVLQISGLIVFNSDNLVITHFLGAAEVTPYSIAWRLCGYASMFQAMIVPSLWPAFSEAYHRSDLSWVRKTYRRVMVASLAAVAFVALLIGLFGRPIIRIWAGPTAVPESVLLWTMSAWVVLLSYTVNQAMLLAATRRIQLQAVTAVVAAIVNLVLSIILVQRIGALGVLVGTITSYVLFVWAPQGYEIRRVLRGDRLLAVAC